MTTTRYFVRDHGPGISPAERSRIFEVFFRGVFGKSSRGTGFGLATVQKIARLTGAGPGGRDARQRLYVLG